MADKHAIWLVAVGLLLVMTGTGAAAGRQRTEVRPAKPPVSFIPGAASPEALDAPVLSGLDYTAIAPPGMRIRVIEDEPYTYLRGSTGRKLKDLEGASAISLRVDKGLASWYEARVSLRYHSAKHNSPLTLSFDTAANYVYTHTLITDEIRGDIQYGIHEVRSPLGLTDPDDKMNVWREYLAYSAAVINPNHPDSDSETPYQYTQGQLKVLRRAGARYCLLTIDFSATQFPYGLTLTENIARCVLNRIDRNLKPEKYLSYLAYYPEYEVAIPYYEGEIINGQVADLAERPGEGCGHEPQAITGDVCPDCGSEEEGPFWPANPYADAANYHKLGESYSQVKCSHCLMRGEGPYFMYLPEWDPRYKLFMKSYGKLFNCGTCGACKLKAKSPCGPCDHRSQQCAECREYREHCSGCQRNGCVSWAFDAVNGHQHSEYAPSRH